MNPVSIHRGLAATVDGDGHNVVLAWLADHRGCYELLMIDAETGQTREFPVPFAAGDSPFASVLSSRNRFYSHFDGHFVEFDPAKPGFTFIAKTVPRVAMSMTEGDDGVIWAAIYPNGAAASYNPRTGEFHDYGNLYDQNWMQICSSVAVNDQGWVYLGIGSTASQILALDPKTGEAAPVLPESEREQAYAEVYRGVDGKVYGAPAAGSATTGINYTGESGARSASILNKHPSPSLRAARGFLTSSSRMASGWLAVTSSNGCSSSEILSPAPRNQSSSTTPAKAPMSWRWPHAEWHDLRRRHSMVLQLRSANRRVVSASGSGTMEYGGAPGRSVLYRGLHPRRAGGMGPGPALGDDRARQGRLQSADSV